MKRLIANHPVASMTIGGFILTLVVGVSVIASWAARSDPTVRTLPLDWQTSAGLPAAPVLNIGVDAKGMTLDQFKIAGGTPEAWRPIETSTVKAGGRVFILRRQEFKNKMAHPMVHRHLLCGKVTNGASPIIDTDGMVPFDLGPMKAPARTDGAATRNFPVTIPATVMQDANGNWLAAPRTCVYQSFASFIKHPLQSVDVYFAPVAMTITKP